MLSISIIFLRAGRRRWKRLLEKCQVMERREVGICRMRKINMINKYFFCDKGCLAMFRCGRIRNGIEILLSSRFEIDSLCSLNVYKVGLRVFLFNLPTLSSLIDGRGSESNKRQQKNASNASVHQYNVYFLCGVKWRTAEGVQTESIE
jgi:hypothetical protein